MGLASNTVDRMLELKEVYHRGEVDFSFFVVIAFYTFVPLSNFCTVCLFKSKYEWKYLHIASRMYSQGRFYAKVFSGYSCIQSKLTVE